MLNLSVFVSSPGDVAEERAAVRRVITELENSHLLRGKVHFEIIAWDDPHAASPMEANVTPQDAVNRYSGRPSDCDLTLVILWGRIGTVLPPDMLRADGSRYASGTVWEFEDASSAHRPVWIYRRSSKPQINIDDPDFEAKRNQFAAVQNFFDGFRNPDGSLRAGFNTYADPADFARQLRQHLEAFLNEHLKPVDDVTSASTGIRLLNNLIRTNPAVADAVSRSKEVIENTYIQIDKLELFKALHDALHTIEFDCLRPMKAGGTTSKLLTFKIRFTAQERHIQESIQSREINPALRDGLKDQLELITSAFQTAMNTPGDTSYDSVVNELDRLLSGFPSELDTGIVNAAAELKLDRLIQLMTTVRDQLPASASEHDAEIEPFIRGIDALKRLCDELARLVAEHTQLQRLDKELRTVCVTDRASEKVSGDWERIMRVRAKLSPPYSPRLDAANRDLTDIEPGIKTALGESQYQQAFDLLGAYFEVVRSAFKDVDTSLKDFCIRLSEVSQPLKIILDMCQTGR